MLYSIGLDACWVYLKVGEVAATSFGELLAKAVVRLGRGTEFEKLGTDAVIDQALFEPAWKIAYPCAGGHPIVANVWIHVDGKWANNRQGARYSLLIALIEEAAEMFETQPNVLLSQ